MYSFWKTTFIFYCILLDTFKGDFKILVILVSFFGGGISSLHHNTNKIYCKENVKAILLLDDNK